MMKTETLQAAMGMVTNFIRHELDVHPGTCSMSGNCDEIRLNYSPGLSVFLDANLVLSDGYDYIRRMLGRLECVPVWSECVMSDQTERREYDFGVMQWDDDAAKMLLSLKPATRPEVMMDQQVIDIARQQLNLPDSITDEEIAHGLGGSFLVARIEAGIAWGLLKQAVIDFVKEATWPFDRGQ